jgi:hypothetical protein
VRNGASAGHGAPYVTLSLSKGDVSRMSCFDRLSMT